MQTIQKLPRGPWTSRHFAAAVSFSRLNSLTTVAEPAIGIPQAPLPPFTGQRNPLHSGKHILAKLHCDDPVYTSTKDFPHKVLAPTEHVPSGQSTGRFSLAATPFTFENVTVQTMKCTSVHCFRGRGVETSNVSWSDVGCVHGLPSRQVTSHVCIHASR